MWQPIETAPKDINLLIYGKDSFGEFVVTGGHLNKYGWDVLGSSGYECEISIKPLYWDYPPAVPNA